MPPPLRLVATPVANVADVARAAGADLLAAPVHGRDDARHPAHDAAGLVHGVGGTGRERARVEAAPRRAAATSGRRRSAVEGLLASRVPTPDEAAGAAAVVPAGATAVVPAGAPRVSAGVPRVSAGAVGTAAAVVASARAPAGGRSESGVPWWRDGSPARAQQNS